MNEDFFDRFMPGLLAYVLTLVAGLLTFMILGLIYSGIMHFIN